MDIMNARNSNTINILVVLLLITVVVLSSLVTTHLVNQFEQEEQKKIELWAEATRQFILADADDNIDLLLQVMENNTTIPVYMVDTNYNLLLSLCSGNSSYDYFRSNIYYAYLRSMLRCSCYPCR